MRRAEIESRLAATGTAADDAINLAEAALLLAALDAPRMPLESYHAHIEALSAGVAALAGSDDPLERRTRHLNTVLFDQFGYAGDIESYDDVDNASLIRVIDRRLGLPVSLGILYIHTARSQGWPATGLAFPGHFLVRLEDRDRRAIVDPFHRGQALEAGHLRDLLKQFLGADAELQPEHYAPVGNRAVLLRLQNNIKTRALQEQDIGRASAVLRRMTLVAPETGGVWHELGLVEAKLGNIVSAIAALTRCLECALPNAQRAGAEADLAKLRKSLN